MNIYNPSLEDLEEAVRRSGQPAEQTAPSHEEIEKQAYRIYLVEGCPKGCELRHWLEAEADLKR